MKKSFAAFASVLLVPLFYVMREWHRNDGSVDAEDAVLGWIILAAGAGILSGGLWLLNRKRLDVAAAGAAIAVLLFCFWGYIYDTLRDFYSQKTPPNTPLLLGILIVVGSLGWWSFRKLREGGREKLLQFLALLFGTLALFDGVMMVRRQVAMQEDFPALSKPIVRSSGWNFYLLLFDELAAPEAYRAMGLDISDTENFLRNTGFHVLRNHRSNYNQTVFSMASMLNVDYIPSRANGAAVSVQDYNACLWWIDHSRLPEAFLKNGYSLHNFSIFQVHKQAPEAGKPYFRLGIPLLLSNTFFGRVLERRFESLYRQSASQQDPFYDQLHNQDSILTHLSNIPPQGNHFVYAHFPTPHGPFYFDTTGARLPLLQAMQATQGNEVPYYLANVRHAEGVIQEAVRLIMKRENGKAVVLVMGDHGYRNNALAGNDTASLQAFAAVYFPDKDYHLLQAEMTNVNVMRIAAGKTLGISLPMLADSCVRLGKNTERAPIWW